MSEGEYDSVVVHINSVGGDVFAGIAMYKLLSARGVTTVAEGFACSGQPGIHGWNRAGDAVSHPADDSQSMDVCVWQCGGAKRDGGHPGHHRPGGGRYLFGQDRHTASSSKGTISTFPGKAGQLVYKGTPVSGIHHVGVYGGDGYVYEAKSHSYGVVKTAYKASDWQYWSQCPYCTDDSSSASSSSSTTTACSNTRLTAGTKVTLAGVKLYSSATATSASATKSGTFYIWNATTSNGRIRVTNSAASVGKSGQITGWVNVSDITGTSSTAYAVGNKVKVTGTIYGNGDGTGGSIKKTGATMYVVGLADSKKYTHYIGVAAAKGGARQGWAAPSILTKA